MAEHKAGSHETHGSHSSGSHETHKASHETHKAGSHSSGSHSSHKSAHALSTEDRKEMGDGQYAFPKQRKEPLNDATHVRNAIARFDQVQGVSDEEREEAFGRIRAAAKRFGVEMTETSWKQLGKHPHTANSAQHKKAS